MVAARFPVRILMHNRKYLLFAVLLSLGAVSVYHEMFAVKTRSSSPGMNLDRRSWKGVVFNKIFGGDHQPGDSTVRGFNYTPPTWKPEYKGRANLHVFEDWCGSSTADLRKNLHYPLYPNSRVTVQKLAITPQRTNYGIRIFGYLHPYTDGEFVFGLSSDDNSELWLSTDDYPLNLQLLAWVGKEGTEWTAPGEFDKYASQISSPIKLSAQKKYFFEVLYQQNNRGTDHVEVGWRLLDQDVGFKVIESSDISLYVDESALPMDVVAHIPQTAASHQPTPTIQQTGAEDMLREDPRDTLHKVPLINNMFLEDVLPNCSYKASYTIKGVPLGRYQGLSYVHLSYIYPNDYTRLAHFDPEDSCHYPKSLQYKKGYRFARYMKVDPQNTSINWNQTFQLSHLNLNAHESDEINMECPSIGNRLLHSNDALPVVKAFMDQLNKTHHGEFTLVRVVNVEKRVDKSKGSRYLLELELKDVNGQLLRLSRHIYAPIRQNTEPSSQQPLKLCNPVGFQWNPEVTIHIVVAVKNQARWVLQLIADMEQLFRETGDLNFNLIIIDFSSTDLDVEKALENSSLPRHQFLKRSGNFERAAGLQAAVKLIQDDHSIVFLSDLHINFPIFILDTIRKHCVEGHMAFIPIVMRLGCGAARSDPRGFWEVQGFGLVGIYKSDWDAVGGMNTKDYKDRWGGEDWEFLDRMLMGGLEVERIYMRNYFHHFHSKRGMWRPV
ncbi:beta-1,4-N-acetylgalactosaminyltransferase 3-like [Cebidichthys violaceus]|uniref:beta-1,4-N-acetylgalactosaminyltransferase 3-like n=1 Tax=Cebidichthys violaceus TaxID=271503 RepID=UPI0035CAD66D